VQVIPLMFGAPGSISDSVYNYLAALHVEEIGVHQLQPFTYSRVANVKNRHLQNDLLTAVICWTKNTAVVAVNSMPPWGENQSKCLKNMRLRAVTPGNDNL